DAMLRVARMAVEYRYAFWSDVVVDLIGYRRHGHSEVDDPTTTQPHLYREVESHPLLWKAYAAAAGIDARAADERVAQVQQELEAGMATAKTLASVPLLRELPEYWSPYSGGEYEPSFEVETGVARALLAEIAECLASVPEGFHAHPKVQRG